MVNISYTTAIIMWPSIVESQTLISGRTALLGSGIRAFTSRSVKYSYNWQCLFKASDHQVKQQIIIISQKKKKVLILGLRSLYYYTFPKSCSDGSLIICWWHRELNKLLHFLRPQQRFSFTMLHFPDTPENYKACVFIKEPHPLLLYFHISPQCIIHCHFKRVEVFVLVTEGMTKTILVCHLGIALPVSMGLFKKKKNSWTIRGWIK